MLPSVDAPHRRRSFTRVGRHLCARGVRRQRGAEGCAGAGDGAGGSPRRARRAGLRAETVAAPAGPLRVFAGGSGPTVVLVHGSGGQAGDWYRIVPALANHYTLVIPDLPGHGESAPAEGPLPVSGLAAALGAVIDAKSPDAKVTLVGNSLGGWVSLLYAAQHPERVERVVGIDSSGIYAPLPVSLRPSNRDEAKRLRSPSAAPRRRSRTTPRPMPSSPASRPGRRRVSSPACAPAISSRATRPKSACRSIFSGAKRTGCSSPTRQEARRAAAGRALAPAAALRSHGAGVVPGDVCCRRSSKCSRRRRGTHAEPPAQPSP